MPTVSAQRAFDELMGNVCYGCQRRKPESMSFCRGCYGQLPKALQRKLYQRIGAGYEEAYAEALAHLAEDRDGATK